MADMSEDREDRGDENGAGEKPEDEDSPAEDDDTGRAAGRSWSRYARLAARAGLDLLGTVFALAAFAVALAAGSPWLATVFAVLSVWAAFQSVGSSVIRPGRWSRLVTEGDATRSVLALALLVLAHRRDAAGEYAVAVGVILAVIAVERRIRSAWGGGIAGAQPARRAEEDQPDRAPRPAAADRQPGARSSASSPSRPAARRSSCWWSPRCSA